MPRNWHDFTVLDIGKRKSEVMKIQGFQKTGFTAALAAAIFTANVFGQAMPTATTTETTPPPLVPNTPATAGPYLSPATSQVLQLTQAKVSDTTIMAYVQNSTTMYGLNADQIIYLKQQGVSDGVLNAMLNQSSRVAADIAAQAPSNYGQPTPPEQSSTAVVQPTTAAPSSVYVVPDSQTANYNAWASQYSYPYPVYYSYPYYPYYYWPVTFSFYYGYHGGYYHPWYGGNWHGGTWGGGGVHTGGTWNGGGSHGMSTGGGSFHSGGSMGMGGGGHH